MQKVSVSALHESEQTLLLIVTPYLHIKHFFHLIEEQTYSPVYKPLIKGATPEKWHNLRSSLCFTFISTLMCNYMQWIDMENNPSLGMENFCTDIAFTKYNITDT